MSISIFDLHFPTESFHLLDIAMIVIDKCQPEIDKKKGKLQYSFSLDIDFDLIWQTIDFNTLCISGDRYVTLRNDSKKSLSHNKRKGLSIDDVSIPFTIPEYLRLLDDHIRYSLSAIGLIYVSSLPWDSSITVNFTVWANTLEDYKSELIEKIRKNLSYKTYWDVQEIESTMIAKIRSITIDTKTNNLFLDTEDFWRLFDKVEHPIFPKRKEDSIVICDIYYPKEPLELMLYILLIKWYLLSFKEYRWKFKIDINPDILEQDEPKNKPIKFDEGNGDVYLNGSKRGNLVVNQIWYTLFKLLYDSQNTLLPSRTIMEKCNFKSHTKTDENYIANILLILKKHLGDEFVDTYTERINNQYVLWNKPQD